MGDGQARDTDILFVGGGLACGLAALWLHERRPSVRLLVVESEPHIGGSHTWSFHGSDLSAAQQQCLEPLLACRWSGHDVAFPAHSRTLAGSYASLRSRRFHDVVVERLRERVLLRRRVRHVTPTDVTFDDGTTLSATAVIDGRGFSEVDPECVGYQKFFGLDVRLQRPHGLARPVLMDACVEQIDGFRFFYLLPWSDDRLLVEDTRYSDGSAIDAVGCRAAIEAYVERRGWKIAAVEREERGALPIPLAAAFTPTGSPRENARRRKIPTIGTGAGLFHPTTGYSLPYAVRIADALAALPDLSLPSITSLLDGAAASAERGGSFFRFLNRMLFLGAPPAQRYRLLERFYRMPEPTIERFYEGTLRLSDRARLLLGRPPIPPSAALRCLPEPVSAEAARLRASLFRALSPSEVAR